MLNKKEITKLIAGISKKKQAVNDDIQTAIANIAGHAYEHGDVTGYDSLIAALKGTDLVLVVRHIRTYGFGLLDGKAGAFKQKNYARQLRLHRRPSSCGLHHVSRALVHKAGQS